MTPAACGALVPLRIVHARTSSGPHVKYRISSRLVYPAVVIFPSAEDAPPLASSFCSSGSNDDRRSSSETENGISGSPGLCSSIQALIFGSLADGCLDGSNSGKI